MGRFISKDEVVSELKKGKAVSWFKETEIAQCATKRKYLLERKPDYPDVHASTINSLIRSGFAIECGNCIVENKN